MTPRKIAICCSFDAVGPVSGLSYLEFKERVLAAGAFSALEATADSEAAKLYGRLERDPSVLVDRTGGFPWVKVGRRV